MRAGNSLFTYCFRGASSDLRAVADLLVVVTSPDDELEEFDKGRRRGRDGKEGRRWVQEIRFVRIVL